MPAAVFSGCHEFLGESTLQFGAPPAIAVAARHRDPVAGAVVIPPGLRFRLALAQEINPDTAAVGDSVKVRLLTPISAPPNVLVPAGTAISARIVRLRRSYGRTPSVSLCLKLETADAGAMPIPLHAELDRGHPFVKAKKGALQPRIELGTLQGSENGLETLEFRNVKRNFVIPTGVQSAWVTALQ